MKCLSKFNTIITCLFLFTAVSPTFPADQNIYLQLHARAFDGKQTITDLNKEDFKLTINNEPREILGAVRKTASMQNKPDCPGRNFILSFHMSDYGKKTQEAVSYFISEILDTSDRLILPSPVKLYEINVSANKEKMIREIEELVKKDFDVYKKNITVSRKNIENRIKKMERLFRGSEDDEFLITSFKTICRFLATFPTEFLQFRNLFLLPDMNKYRQVLDFLGNREGERWWVHFQRSDNYLMLPRLQRVTRMIRGYCSVNSLAAKAFSSDLSQLEKKLQLAESFPAVQLLNTFAGGNIRFNAIIRGEQKSRGTKAGYFRFPLERIYKEISRDTGGKTVHTIDPEQGIKQILNHQDDYYQLTYRFNDKIEEKKIHLAVVAPDKKKTNLSYNNHFSEEEIQSLTGYLSGKKIKIADFSLNKRVIKFSISSIAFHKKEPFGLVKIRVELFDRAGNSVYRSENILRSTKKRITVSLPVPAEYRGTFKLVITACDRVANQLASFHCQIALK